MNIERVIAVAMILAGSLFFLSIFYSDKQEFTSDLINTGEHYKKECTLIEANINNGFLSADTNRINCDGVIYNIPTRDYINAVGEYELSQHGFSR